MPLRDHFRPPISRIASWEAVHGGWPMMIAQSLNGKLPARFVAHPNVHLGMSAEIDVSAYEKDELPEWSSEPGNGVATAVATAAPPTLDVATDLPAQDEYEVRVFDVKRDMRLVAAVELVSPANKDRPEHRQAFVAKCLALLQNQVSVTIVDVVTMRSDNLYAEMLDAVGQTDPSLGKEAPSIYAVACRATKPNPKPKEGWRLQAWNHRLEVGKPLPTLPLWLAVNCFVALELEETYEQTCKALRIT